VTDKSTRATVAALVKIGQVEGLTAVVSEAQRLSTSVDMSVGYILALKHITDFVMAQIRKPIDTEVVDRIMDGKK
jgi:hypothetical protein